MKKKPTKEATSIKAIAARYERWVKYLTKSRQLTPAQVHDRATKLSRLGREPD